MFISRKTSIHSLAATALALTALQSVAGSPPPPPSPTLYDGRYYQVVIANKITWDAAKTAAEALTYQGIQGRLATIGSAEEDAFVHQLRQQVLSGPHIEISGTELWVGGYQVPCATSAPEPGCGWLWLNGAAIAPANTSSPYTNWLPGEPDNIERDPDATTLASEDNIAIGRNGAFGWNDEGNLRNIWGYVVEYGDNTVTIPAADCAAGGPGCNPTGAQVMQFPATAKVKDGATLTARTFRIQDDPSRCGKDPLTLFDGAVVIPPYLCGHPDFVVIETSTTDVEIASGAILVENLTEDVLPDNLYGCTAVRQNPAGVIDPDPSHRDVVAWQTTDPAKMLETTRGTGRFFGTLTEVTYACGSSRGKVVNGSYHFVGLRIHPGAGNEYIGNTSGNHQSFVDLTRYKLEVLQASVVASKAALPKTTYQSLKALVDHSIHFHDRGKYNKALQNIKLFLQAVDRAKYKTIPGQNFNGDHVMRGSNIEFMYAEKVIKFEPY